MKTILVILCLAASLCGAAQDTTVVKMEYFIDDDPGVNNAISITIPPGIDVTFPFMVDITGYTGGYHKLYIRTKDNLGRWSLTARRNIEVLPIQANNNVVSGEYFIDEDPGFGAASPVTVSTPDIAILQDFTAALSGLSEGYHKLYGRFKDTHGNWSLTFRRNIEVIKNENNLVINGEYFFRTDNGFGDCTPVVFSIPSADGTFSFNIPGSQIPANADTLFIRVRDDIENRWSITQYSTNLGPLPLTLLNFTAIKHLNTANLQWQTTNEVNTSYFNIERSTDALHFNTVGKVTANNRSGTNNYSYADNLDGLSGRKLYYRLQQVDIDAKSQYSKIVAINIDDSKSGISISPNPARNYINIMSANLIGLNGAVIAIVDMAGHIALKQSLTARDKQQINISALAKGMYMVHIVKASGVETQKLLKE